MTNIVSFYPKHADLSEEESDELIAKYRAWLDQHGDYGRLYMMNIDKLEKTDINSKIIGVKIYDSEIAMLFRLMFEI